SYDSFPSPIGHGAGTVPARSRLPSERRDGVEHLEDLARGPLERALVLDAGACQPQRVALNGPAPGLDLRRATGGSDTNGVSDDAVSAVVLNGEGPAVLRPSLVPDAAADGQQVGVRLAEDLRPLGLGPERLDPLLQSKLPELRRKVGQGD